MLRRKRPVGRPGSIILTALSLQAFSAWAQDTEPEEQEPPAAPDGGETREQQLEERIEEMEKKYEALVARMEEESLERMIQDAENEARAAEEEPRPEDREFLVGALSLQKLNPEISFSADMLAGLVIDDTRFYAGEDDRSGMPVREIGLHFQHVLDPFSMFKSAIAFSPSEGVAVEEVYVSWFGIIPSVSFTLGRFRQNFGVLNRWHVHDLDQTRHPLAMRLVLGDEGLVGDGFSVRWLMPSLLAHVNELTLEVVDGSNETLFAGEHFSIPSTMLHLKNYYDLSDDTYLELGLSGMFGFNNRRGLLNEERELVDEPWRKTWVAGADLTVFWSPLQQAKYKSFTWRSEFFYAGKELGPLEDAAYGHSWGAYSYLQFQLAERWFAGVRGDIVLPTERDSDELAWDAVPYLTFWQSEFVYFRLEYQHGQDIPCTAWREPNARLAGYEEIVGRRTDNRVLLQVDFAAGPHKHEKY